MNVLKKDLTKCVVLDVLGKPYMALDWWCVPVLVEFEGDVFTTLFATTFADVAEGIREGAYLDENKILERLWEENRDKKLSSSRGDR